MAAHTSILSRTRTLRASCMIAALLASVCLPASARDVFSENTGDSFGNSKPVDDSQLSEMRGGFVSIGGLTIDFALTTKVLVDGQVESDFSINSDNLDGIISSDLQRIVQIGAGNTNAALEELRSNPSVLTVIQNSENDRVIQTLNQLDITVSDTQNFINSIVTNTLNTQAVDVLR